MRLRTIPTCDLDGQAGYSGKIRLTRQFSSKVVLPETGLVELALHILQRLRLVAAQVKCHIFSQYLTQI